jgi:hypothetical protein
MTCPSPMSNNTNPSPSPTTAPAHDQRRVRIVESPSTPRTVLAKPASRFQRANPSLLIVGATPFEQSSDCGEQGEA